MIPKKTAGRPKKEPTITMAFRVPAKIAEPFKVKANKIIKKLKRDVI